MYKQKKVRIERLEQYDSRFLTILGPDGESESCIIVDEKTMKRLVREFIKPHIIKKDDSK